MKFTCNLFTLKFRFCANLEKNFPVAFAISLYFLETQYMRESTKLPTSSLH